MKKTTIEFPDDDPNEGPPPRKVSADELFEPQWTPIENLPDPAGFAINFTHRAIEVLHGIRDAAQLARWVSEDVYGIMRRTAIAEARKLSLLDVRDQARMAPVFRLMPAKVTSPRQGVIEASITVVFPYKVRAAALRLEGIDGRWRVTAFGLIT